MKINRDSNISSYAQIANQIRAAILIGNHSPGSRLPAEGELVKQSGCSRITVRQALKVLEDEGWIERKQGIGTFVCDRLSQELSRVQTITEVMRSKGISPGVKVLEFGAVVPPKDVAKAMDMSLRTGPP